MRYVAQLKWLVIISLLLVTLVISLSCTKEKVIIYKSFSEQVQLTSPPNTDLTYTTFPGMSWEQLDVAQSYQLHISTSATFANIMVDTTVVDTFYNYNGDAANDTYYWRVRVQNGDDIWSDWSDAAIWSFRVNDDVDYLALVSTIPTYGIAQDVHIVEESPDSIIAYVGDGQAGLTMVNVTDPENPVMMANIDLPEGDFLFYAWKAPGDSIAWTADRDHKIALYDIRFPIDENSPFNQFSLGTHQNISDICAFTYEDTFYVFSASSNYQHRRISVYGFQYLDGYPAILDGWIFPDINVRGDCIGVDADTVTRIVEYYYEDRDSTYYEEQSCFFAFGAASEAGLWVLDCSRTHSFHGEDTLLVKWPRVLGSTNTVYSAVEVQHRGGYVYVADDRGGLQIFALPDTIPAFDHSDTTLTANPILISDINTSGRTKDVHLQGNYCYLADASGGLKIIDVTDPYNPVFLDAYDTPYAYGVYADEDYIYVCDRDNGLMIFENGDLIN